MGMELFVENGISLTRLFQENFLNLHSLMQVINAVTEPEFVILLFLVIYWGKNRALGSKYLYLWGVVLAIFSILQHVIQFPSPFWLDPTVLLEESGSFSAPNINIAFALLLILPFKRLIRADLVLVVFILMAILTGVSQIYLGVASFIDVLLGLLFGVAIIGGWSIWNRRFGKAFAGRILGQRFWMAVLFPMVLAAGYFGLIGWVHASGYTGIGNIDPAFYWRAWQLGFINAVSALALLTGIGTGIALETGRLGFRPSGSWGEGALSSVLGFAVISALLYLINNWAPVTTVYETGRLLDYAILAVKCAFIATTFTYLLPWLFTAIGSAQANLSKLPEISLNKFA